MSFVAHPTQLIGHHVHLVPLHAQHLPALCEAVADGQLWQLWFTAIPTPSGMAAEIERRLQLRELGQMYPFAALDARTGQAVGMTSYMHIDAAHLRVEIGSTWYRQSVQRTALNTEAKWLLLAHAFEALHCNAVELRTHSHNSVSRRAIERLGAQLDGVLRHHQINPHPLAPSPVRDTCVYSLLASEWPHASAALRQRLAASTAGD